MTNNYEFEMLNIVKGKLNKYEKVSESFQRFFDSDHLDRVLDQKADLQHIDQLDHRKVDVKDYVSL
jgi:hypothetical protein